MDIINREIASYSLVSSLWSKNGKGYLDCFVPLFTTLLLKKKIDSFKPIDLPNLSGKFCEEYSVEITLHPLTLVVDKCRKLGILRKEHHTFRVIPEIAKNYDITVDIMRHLEQQEFVTKTFREYSLSQFQINLSAVNASNLIIETLKTNDLRIMLLNSNHRTDEANIVVPHRHKKYSQLVSRFIIHQHNNNYECFKNIVAISMGNIVANAFMLNTHQWSDNSLKECIFFVDTPLLLKTIGCDGDESEKATRQLLDHVVKQGGQIKIWDHTLEECKRTLAAAAEWVESSSFNPMKANRTTLFFRQEGYTRERVELLPHKLNRLMTDLFIQIEEAANPIGNERFNVDWQYFENELERCISENDPSFDASKFKYRTYNDVASVASTYILRQGKRSNGLREARFFFLTNNSAIIRADSKMANTKLGYKNGEYIVCLSEAFLGAYIWAGSPKVASEVETNRLIAYAYSSIRPDQILENRLSLVAEGLIKDGRISNEEYMLLNASFLNKDLLSQKSLGDPNQVVEITAIEILDEIKQNLLGKVIHENTSMAEAIKELEVKAIKDHEIHEQALNKLTAIAAKRAFRNYRIKKGSIISIAVLIPLIPLIPAFFLTWYWIFVSAASLLGQSYLSFFKGFLFPDYFHKMHAREISKQRAKLEI